MQKTCSSAGFKPAACDLFSVNYSTNRATVKEHSFSARSILQNSTQQRGFSAHAAMILTQAQRLRLRF